ncbi:MAG: DUF4157 domain-containing protein [Rubrivivax sp.]|nr:MAG: DUF4157 domain-containing protein [Rubrivivax sp.]
MAASAPPVADTKKPAPQPLEKKGGKDGAGATGQKAPQATPAPKAGGDKAADKGGGAGKGASQAPADKPVTPQQRVDRMAVRARLDVSQPGDATEREADQVAEKVTRELSDPSAKGAQGGQPGQQPLQIQRRAANPQQVARAPAATDTKAASNAPPPPPPATVQADEVRHQIAQSPGVRDPQERLKAQAGKGEPLPEALRGKLENAFGRDLSGVRLHTDTDANELARDYSAQAFTVGHDIYFASGRFDPATPGGMNLLAHELTHVAQQGPGVQRKPAAAAAAAPAAGSSAAGAVDHAAKTINIPVLQVPSYSRKAAAIPQPLALPRNPTRPSDQRQVFATGIQATGGYSDAVKKNLDTKRGVKNARTGKMVHVVQPKSSETYFIGEADSLAAKMALPRWNKAGAFSSYDVDHIREMQLGGSNTLDNMELLDSSANRSSGSLIHGEIVSKINAAIQPEVGAGKHWKKAPDVKKVQSEYQVTFAATSPTLKVAGNSGNFWSVNDVSTGEHAKATKTLTAAQINAKKLVGDETHLTLYPRAGGGGAHVIPWKPDTNTPGAFGGKGIFKNFIATGITYAPGAGGTITGTKKFGKDLLEEKTVSWKLSEMEGLDYTVYVDKASVLASMGTATLPGMSPITFSEVDLDDHGALGATGVLRPSLPLLDGLEIDITVADDQVWLSKTFSGPELALPGPVQVMSSTLTVAAGTGGLKVDGDVDYEITKLGKGRISGMGSFGGGKGAGFGIKGNFELDKTVFDGEARIEAGYENEAFWAKGHLSIAEGKVQGIQSASIDAAFAQDTFSATGTVVPKMPAVESATLGIEYSEAAGLKFAGDLAFKGNPLISEGKLHVEAQQPPGGAGFKVKGTGSAKPNIPGLASELTASYDDGAFVASFSGAYHKGMMAGQVNVGVTNCSVDEQGNLGGLADPLAPLTVYGSGSATLKIAPWLQATAGIRFSPTGEVTVSGEIGLPGNIELFPRQEVDKTLFNLSTQIPIVPGVVAEVGGNLKAKAGFGPGVLDQLRLGIEYNPAQEENTHITGDAHVKVPGDAGLRLAARAGIGLGITGASATGGIELGGALGIDGAAEAGVHVDWTPRTGLAIEAEAAFSAQPKFKFDVSGYVSVKALGFEVYDNRWELAAFEMGSDLKFGVRFPVKYKEGEAFNVSLDDVEFEVPDVDPGAMVEQLGDRIF